jgi:hypothetical protein
MPKIVESPAVETKTSTPKILENKTKKKKVEKPKLRKTIFKEVAAKVCQGASAITPDDAKDMLGWREETEQEKFKEADVTFRHGGRKIMCVNNINNRKVYPTTYEALKQDMLRGRWRLNGETIIIGTTGLILNGQHTLIALVLAAEAWRDQKETWKATCPKEPRLQKVVVYGVLEDDETVNTMDTCKARSLADVLFRSEFFNNISDKVERDKLARMTERAVRLLWTRTGLSANPFGRKTHAEFLDLIGRHTRLLECVKHIHEEDSEDGRIKRCMNLGDCAGLLYLMGCSSTDPKEYQSTEQPHESMLKWSNWDKACNFFVEIGASSERFQELRLAFANLDRNENAGQRHRVATMVKAWLAYSEQTKIERKHLTLKYEETDQGIKVLADSPLVGGIDLGEFAASERLANEEAIEAETPTPEPTKPEPKKNEKKAGKRALQEALSKPPKLKVNTLTVHKAGEQWAKDDVAYVHARGEEPYKALLTGEPYETATGMTVMVDGEDGGNWEVRLDQLSTSLEYKPPAA